jgi:hypothetical protein
MKLIDVCHVNNEHVLFAAMRTPARLPGRVCIFACWLIENPAPEACR